MSNLRTLCSLPSVKKQKPFFFVQCIIKQLLNSFFVISRIIKVSVRVISQSRRLRLITLTSTLIILDITKTSSNNCLITHSGAGFKTCKTGIENIFCPILIWCIVSYFAELVVLEVSEEFISLSGAEQEATFKGNYERTVTNNAKISNSTCPSGLQYHPKLCKVSIGENVSLEQSTVTREQNLGGVMLNDSNNSHRPHKDSSGSAVEKLVESAHFGKLGTVIYNT